MSDIKSLLIDTSFFRKCYIICLFLCQISFLQIFTYVTVPFLFIWGVVLIFRNEIKHKSFRKLRYGLWIAAFIICTSITSLIYIMDNFYMNLIMIFHISICFFIFYGMHTEENVNHTSEIYSISRFIVYATTILGIIGLILLMCGVSFEFLWVKFVIYENRFTGLYSNPNLLGFSSVVALFSCNILIKDKFIKKSGQTRVSHIWIAACVMTSLISLFLCDSNASLVLCMAYGIFIVANKFVSRKKELTPKKFIKKIGATAISGVIIVFSLLMIRYFCQTGFSLLMVQKAEVQQGTLTAEQIGEITSFSHENTNIDSGRFKLIENSAELFLKYPILGIGKGNIIEYSQKYVQNSKLAYNLNFSDLHNGYLTILLSGGIIGFALFTIFGIRFGKNVIQVSFKNRTKFKDTEIPCVISFICAYLIYALFEKALLYDVSFMVMYFWLIMGYISTVLVKYKKEDTEQNLLMQRRLKRHMI